MTYISSARRALALLLAFSSVLLLLACSSSPSVEYGNGIPTLSDDELPAPVEAPTPDDVSHYPTLANNVFAGVAVAPATDFTYEKKDNAITLTSYVGAGDVLIIPDTIDNLPVTALCDGLFKNNTSLKALSIPDSVTTIGADLLNGCRSLQVIKTPQMSHLRHEDGYLAYLFGGSSPQLGSFKVGSSLDTVILTDAVTQLDSLAFYGCYRLIMVILPQTLTEVGDYAFWGCTALKYAALPQSLITLGEGAFVDCTSLQSMYIPDSVQHVGIGALMNCTALMELSLPFIGQSRTSEQSHLGYIFGAEAYVWNNSFLPASLRSVTLRQGNVPNYAFYECDHLYSVTLPADCQSVGVRAFHACTSLLSLTLPNTVTHVGDMAFSDCLWLDNVTLNDGLVEIGMQAFMGCINLTEIVLPDSLTMLCPSLFSGCKRLRSVTLGEQLTTVDDYVFHNCISLSEVKTKSGDVPTADQLTVGVGNTFFEHCLIPPTVEPKGSNS